MTSIGIFLLKRLAGIIPVLFLLPLFTFVLMHWIPGNYFDSLRLNPQITPETIQKYETLYRLNEPVLVQYWHWLKNMARFDFGYSFSYQQPVINLLASRLGNTLVLTLTAFLLAWMIAVPLGLWAGLSVRKPVDRICRAVAYFGLSIPNFLLCILLLWAASRWGGFPLGGIASPDAEDYSIGMRIWDRARHMAIPVFVLTLSSFAYLFRLMRAQTLEVMDRDFVFFLRAQRVPESKIIFRHVARNAINPLVSLLGLEIPVLFSGAALVEIFTGWPGLGSLMLQAVRSQDQFLVLGNMMILAVLLVAGNLLADILLAIMDPRIRISGERS